MSRIEAGNVMVVDGGGRGSALVDKYAQSEHVESVLAVPGNDLMRINTDKPVQIYPQLKTTSVEEIAEICVRQKVSLVDVAQDNAVEAGLVDRLQAVGISVVGPTRVAGQIEWSKAWAREFGGRRHIPQPFFKICLSQEEGIAFLQSQPDQAWFVKASGLAEGKGALPARNNKEAIERVREMERFKDAGKVFLIEKWLRGDDSPGEEFSAYIFSDGENFKFAGSAQDYKRANDNDEGENTGSMGCNSPALVLTPDILQEIESNIFRRAINGLREEGRPYKGVLYLGGMVIREGGRQTPYAIEFNARWGDPEAQAIVPGIINDFFEVGIAIADGDIRNLQLQTDGMARVVVAAASKGYPGNYDAVRGKEIFGIKEARTVSGVRFYSAGIKEDRGRYYANGGRLFYIVGVGKDVIEAQERAYEAMSFVSIEGNNLHFRTDIGWRDVERLRQRRG
ncbi:MAG: phosphoribosylamine--glycine ligase [Patescibacteria group bacterium]